MYADPTSKGQESETLASTLSMEEIEAWNMWIYKTHGILPTQYHHFYNQGDTMIYREHIQDILTIDKIWANKQEKENHKKASKNPKNNPLAGQQKKQGLGGGGFYGQTFRYSK